jgi:tRNA A58 N-methylase Trm61
MIHNAVTFAHALLKQHVRFGDIVIDATVGNGHDTDLLLTLVGDRGTVYGFDVQSEAIESTQRSVGARRNLVLIQQGHENMDRHVPETAHGHVSAVVFNLGYLPGGDKSVTTRTETTLQALQAAQRLLSKQGLIVLVCYRHEEGERELAALRAALSLLEQDHWTITETSFINQVGKPPVVLACTRYS